MDEPSALDQRRIAAKLVAQALHAQGAIPDPEDEALLLALSELTPEQLERAKEICAGTPGADPFLVSLILKAFKDAL